MSDYNYVSYMNVMPLDIKPDDAIALKIVAVAGYGHSWAAYMGESHWGDSEVAIGGDKISQAQAEIMFPQFKNAGWRYRP